MNDLDYQILQIVHDRPEVAAGAVRASLPEQEAIPLRIRELVNDEMMDYTGDVVTLEHIAVIDDGAKLRLTILGRKILEDYNCTARKQYKLLRNDYIIRITPITISIIALIEATISLLQSLGWIHLAR